MPRAFFPANSQCSYFYRLQSIVAESTPSVNQLKWMNEHIFVANQLFGRAVFLSNSHDGWAFDSPIP